MNKLELIPIGQTMKCQFCYKVFGLFAEKPRTDAEILRLINQYSIWRLDIRLHRANCVGANNRILKEIAK